MITVEWRYSIDSGFATYDFSGESFADPRSAAEMMSSVELYDNLYPWSVSFDTDVERQAVARIRYNRFSPVWGS